MGEIIESRLAHRINNQQAQGTAKLNESLKQAKYSNTYKLHERDMKPIGSTAPSNKNSRDNLPSLTMHKPIYGYNRKLLGRGWGGNSSTSSSDDNKPKFEQQPINFHETYGKHDVN